MGIPFRLILMQSCQTSFCNRCLHVQVAFIGFVVQALVTRSNGPIEDLQNHISGPFSNNILTNVINLPQTLTKA